MRIEKLLPLFISEKDEVHLIQSMEYLRRVDSFSGRWYYKMQDNDPVFFLSTTSFIKKSLPPSKYLEDWKISMVETLGSKDDMDDFVDQTATYGTIMHLCIAEIVKKMEFNFEYMFEFITEQLEERRSVDLIAQRRHLMKDILAFMQWVYDYNAKPLAIEYPITHPKYALATCIDFVAEIDVEEEGFFGEVYLSGDKKGLPKKTKQTKRKVVVIDFKSGRKGFHDAHEMQLQICLEMWNSRFLNTPYEAFGIFNWAPKAWTFNPAYKFADQTKNRFVGKLQEAVNWATIVTPGLFDPSFSEVMAGNFQYGEVPTFDKENIYSIVKRYELEKAEQAENEG